MTRIALVLLFLTLSGQPILAACSGRNLVDSLPTETRNSLTAAAEAQPYARGNFWRARRGSDVIYLLGTYHLDDPRHDAVLARIATYVESVAIVLVEAGPEETSKLQDEVSKNPGLLFVTEGPTMPELLAEPEWQALAAALRERGFPPFLAAKMRPWFIAAMLSFPPCAGDRAKSRSDGLDARLIALAGREAIPVQGLEPYDTVFTLFGTMTSDQQIDMIRTTLTLNQNAADQSATMADLYFAENARLIWELGRLMSYDLPGKSRDEVDGEYAMLEEAVMYRRNRAWIPVITAALEEGPVFAGFGALHLSGKDGVLALLEREGFALEPLPF